MGIPIETIIAEFETFIGTLYEFGGEETNCAPNDIDCSEGVESACKCTGVTPVMPDGSANQFNHCDRNGRRITFEEARNTRGALLFKSYGTSYPPGDRNEGGIYHVAMSLGNDTTMEICCSDGDNVGHMSISGRSWYGWGGLIPGADYSPITQPPLPKDDDMIIWFLPTGVGGILVNGKFVGITGDVADQLRSAGWSSVQLDEGTYASWAAFGIV